MKKSRFAVILKVANLDLCRFFYQNILNLGEPEMNSSFRVEFRTGEDCSLILELKSADEVSNAADSQLPLAWKIRVDDLTELKERLLDYGYEAPLKAKDFNGEFLLGCKDPEGNIFYLESD
ncbi:MAG: VOC family protein [Victivallaceae bacterium]|jgi:catechol-2,3-dioxygenase|nr:VOC family protein [Victivallaceae bacterium]NLK83384.1 VOC family protein [Lentisphaerota bacterium]MDD3116507.1 VOC family protein [Victivallaceae bacterium]MDD3704193.1 VOC family protein [Victivallaceae bacterium]MDD4317769.1 VOC family protein [Victivallaceae bacterium]